MAPRRYERLASAGPAMGILEPMLVRAYLREGAALPRQTAVDDTPGLHAGATVELFAAGIAEQVVKADIASLYPSLMRTYGIGPACDRRDVLLSIVDRLTDLRLDHKAAAKVAAPGSPEAGHHDATQAAIKVLINSAYGYMGAGAMALFADRRAADEVTRRGRAVLAQVVAALRERGMALIEADTDGVYFAVPTGWTEAQERALVADVAATLPDGIRLEYEGRYRAMFSHEVKNYALLTYGGDLILRGVALRSSRAEPFGVHFLRSALRCTLQGDIAGVHQAFLQCVDMLRERTLPVDDVAARVRLTKTPEVYGARRDRLQEAQYEALLAAGRTDWAVGERVRCYRARGGRFVWLPDENEELGDSDSWEVPGRTGELPPYDVEHYLQVLVTTYAGRLRKAFAPEVWEQLFRLDQQTGLFDLPIEEMQPLWIRCK
jgi:DNA polymerase elongation subunit (family B)